MGRDGIFGLFFLGVTPWIKKCLVARSKSDIFTSILAGATSGILAAIASQGLDTLKTIQQNAPPQKAISLQQAAKNMYLTQGVSGFFTGGFYRGMRSVAAITFLTLANEKAETILMRQHLKNMNEVQLEEAHVY